MPNWFRQWRRRHQHPVSFALHVLAIPMIPLAGVLAAIQLADGAWSLWWRPATLLGISYGLQWIGHRLEGNDMGEIILIKKMLGKPFIAVAPDNAGPGAAAESRPTARTARGEPK